MSAYLTRTERAALTPLPVAERRAVLSAVWRADGAQKPEDDPQGRLEVARWTLRTRPQPSSGPENPRCSPWVLPDLRHLFSGLAAGSERTTTLPIRPSTLRIRFGVTAPWWGALANTGAGQTTALRSLRSSTAKSLRRLLDSACSRKRRLRSDPPSSGWRRARGVIASERRLRGVAPLVSASADLVST
jgi:hypothetical protein